MKTQVAIVGAGLAGLSCARRLERSGIDWMMFEASDAVGGRVRTDIVDGFRLDRGFQVLLEAYPETKAALDYQELDLRPFLPGAKVMVEGRFHTVADPLRSPSNLFNTVNAPIGSLMDKIRIMALRNRAMQGSLAELFRKPESTTRAALEQIGFSRQMIEAFFEPWLGGIFLSRELDTSSRMLDFVIRMMATGRTSVPAEGMGRISDQLATNLDNTKAIRLNSPVAKVESGRLELADGEVIEADRIVLATEAPAVSKLLGQSSDAADERGVTCLYYTMAESPIEGPWLILDGDRSGPVNNVAIMSQVSAAYAPKGRELAAVTVLGADRRVDGELRKSVERQLRRWFGGAAAGWDFLKSYRIAHAQPAQPPGFRESRSGPYEPLPGVIVCGDHRETASINGAMRSGRHAGTIISRHLGLSREAVA